MAPGDSGWLPGIKHLLNNDSRSFDEPRTASSKHLTHFFFFFLGSTCGMLKCLGQGSNRSHNSDKAKFLTPRATRELLDSHLTLTDLIFVATSWGRHHYPPLPPTLYKWWNGMDCNSPSVRSHTQAPGSQICGPTQTYPKGSPACHYLFWRLSQLLTLPACPPHFIR